MTFRSHLDGAMVELTPERAIEVQILLGSDIAMLLRSMSAGRRAGGRCPRARARTQGRRVGRAVGSRRRGGAAGQALFGIVQGGIDTPRRLRQRRRAGGRSTSMATRSAVSRSARGITET